MVDNQGQDRRPATAGGRDDAGPMHRLLHRVLWSRGWDIATRLIGAGCFGFFVFAHIVLLLRLVSETGAFDLSFGIHLAARAALIMFFALFMLMFFWRIGPIGKASGLGPRLVALGGTFLPTLIPSLIERHPPDPTLDLISAVLIAIGFGLTVYALTHLSRSLSLMPEARRLVTTGPYRWMRHPVYLFEEIGIVGALLPYLSTAAVLLWLAHLLCQFQRMANEEQVLGRAFPDYAGYAERTARLIPRFY